MTAGMCTAHIASPRPNMKKLAEIAIRAGFTSAGSNSQPLVLILDPQDRVVETPAFGTSGQSKPVNQCRFQAVLSRRCIADRSVVHGRLRQRTRRVRLRSSWREDRVSGDWAGARGRLASRQGHGALTIASIHRRGAPGRRALCALRPDVATMHSLPGGVRPARGACPFYPAAQDFH